MRVFYVLCLLAGLSCQGTVACAETAIAYSAADNVYGWCAYNDGRDTGVCAVRQCQTFGGAACQQVARCDGGWSAVALAQSPAVGVGVACGMGNQFTARAIALTACMAAVNANCWTNASFDANGNPEAQESIWAGDRWFFAEGLLQLRNVDGIDLDGEPDASSRAALSAFQARVGLPATGEADDDTLARLFWAVAMHSVVRELKAFFLDKDAAELAGRVYGHAEVGDPVRTFGQELLAMPEDRRLLAVATYLSARDTPCAPPARSASAPFGDESSDLWSVECAEGSYTLIVSDDGSSIVTGN